MTAGLSRPRTKMLVGDGLATSAMRQLPRDDALIVADERSPTDILGVSPDAWVTAEDVDDGFVASLAERFRATEPAVIVAIGGGTVLDAVKIAALAAASERLFEHVLRNARRSALTLLPGGAGTSRVVAIPTTPGTSSETNAVAVLKNSAGYRLVVGEQLRPRQAILDGKLLMSLPVAAIREACLEALLRLAGAHSSRPKSANARRDAIRIGQALVRAGDAAFETAEQRLRVSRLSAATQTSAALQVRDPFAARHWYVANEVSFALGVRKMVATASVVAAVWSQVARGDVRWGDSQRLHDYWHALSPGRERQPGFAERVDELIDRWGIHRTPQPSGAEIDHISDAVIRAWGRVGALRRISADDVRAILGAARWGHPAASVDGSHRPALLDREEVIHR